MKALKITPVPTHQDINIHDANDSLMIEEIKNKSFARYFGIHNKHELFGYSKLKRCPNQKVKIPLFSLKGVHRARINNPLGGNSKMNVSFNFPFSKPHPIFELNNPSKFHKLNQLKFLDQTFTNYKFKQTRKKNKECYINIDARKGFKLTNLTPFLHKNAKNLKFLRIRSTSFEQIEKFLRPVRIFQDLTHLKIDMTNNQNIYFMSNSINEEVFQHISKMKSLLSLTFNLNDNESITGEQFRGFGSKICQLVKLQQLRLKFPQSSIVQKDLIQFASDLSKIKALRELKLHLITKATINPEAIPNELQQLINLTFVNFSVIGLGQNNSRKKQNQCFSMLKNLKELYLNYSFIRTNDLEVWKNFFQGFENLSQLETLRISFESSTIPYSEFSRWPNIFSQLKSLKYFNLNLKDSQLNPKMLSSLCLLLESIAQQLEKLTLSLKQYHITENEVKLLSECISKMQNLNTLDLDLDYCKISNEGAFLLFSAFRSLPQLQVLDVKLLQGNLAVKNSSNYFCSTFKGYKQLKTLKLKLISCDINDAEHLLKIFSEISDAPALECLELQIGSTKINWDKMSELEKYFFKLQNLKALSFTIEDLLPIDSAYTCLANCLCKLSKIEEIQLFIRSYKGTEENDARKLYYSINKLEALRSFDLQMGIQCLNWTYFQNELLKLFLKDDFTMNSF